MFSALLIEGGNSLCRLNCFRRSGPRRWFFQGLHSSVYSHSSLLLDLFLSVIAAPLCTVSAKDVCDAASGKAQEAVLTRRAREALSPNRPGRNHSCTVLARIYQQPHFGKEQIAMKHAKHHRLWSGAIMAITAVLSA